MFRTMSLAPRARCRRLVSALAMSVALAGASMTFSAPAAAQEYSEGFVALYQPAAEALNAEGADIAAVGAQFPAIVAAAQTPDDRFAIGNLLLIAGNRAENQQWQRQGLELMVSSGKAAPEQIGQFQYFIGNLAFTAQDYAAARTALQAAQQAGYSAPDADIQGLIVETYFAEGQNQAGIDYVLQATEERRAAGGQVPERWLLRALQAAYNQQLTDKALDVSEQLVTSYPTERNWLNTLQVVNALNDFDPQQQLDLLRLMRETKALTNRAEYVRYIEAADPRVMANEVGEVLAAGLAAGQFSAGDAYYQDVKRVVDQRAPVTRREAPGLVTEARGASDPLIASEAGDRLMSIDDFAQAEAMYQMALDKGHRDRDAMLTRLGIAQAKQGKFAEAQATLDQVSGARAPIARMWSLYAETQAG